MQYFGLLKKHSTFRIKLLYFCEPTAFPSIKIPEKWVKEETENAWVLISGDRLHKCAVVCMYCVLYLATKIFCCAYVLTCLQTHQNYINQKQHVLKQFALTANQKPY